MDELTLRRRKLAEIRQRISNQTSEMPFSLSEKLSTGETISEFVIAIALNIHRKRVKKI